MDLRPLLLTLAGSAIACTSGNIGGAGGPTEAPPAQTVRVVEGAPLEGAAIERVPVATTLPPQLVSVVDGVVAVGTSEGLLVGSSVEPDVLAELPVIAEPTEPDATGAIGHVARRTTGGLLVAADNGLFHSAPSMLLPSPLGASLSGATLLSIDALGEGEAEELWIATDAGLHLVRAGEIHALTIPGAAPVEAAVGVAPSRALVAAGGAVYDLDAGALEAVAVASELGEVHGFDRADDGGAHLATDAGLLSRDKGGELVLRTFAAAGEPAARTLGVTAAFGSLVATTENAMILVEGDEAHTIAEIAAAPNAVAVDAIGDTWATDGGALFRWRSGKPVSFAQDVAPFFAEHCTSCHTTAKDGAPKFDLEDYETAKDRAAVVLKRLRALGAPPMPPASVEVLTAPDFAVVTRWVATGLSP